MKKFFTILSFVLALQFLFVSCNKPSTNNYEATQEFETVNREADSANLKSIHTIEDLMAISKNGQRGENYILMNDLDFSSVKDWNGIYCTGRFNGNNHTIKNFKSTTGGLFLYALTVTDLNMENIEINFDTSKYKEKTGMLTCTENIGGIADSGFYFYNCSVSGNIQFTINGSSDTDSDGSNYYIGSVVGKGLSLNDEEVKVVSCRSGVNIKINGKESENIYAGGIIGCADSLLNISNCSNNGNINLSAKRSKNNSVGGICGKSGTDGEFYKNCNFGEISCNGVSGGIVGVSDKKTTIDSCYNCGKIKCGESSKSNGNNKISCAGGIIGLTLKAYEGSNIDISNSYNVGLCTDADCCGEIVGGVYSRMGINISNCAFSNKSGLSVTGVFQSAFPDNKAMSLEEMKDISNYPFDNKSDTWKNGAKNYKYPIFQ